MEPRNAGGGVRRAGTISLQGTSCRESGSSLERNPFYWKVDRAGNRLPYLDRLVFIFVPSEDAQAVRFQSGEADITTRLSATNFDVLLKDQGNRNYELLDLGPGLDYTFLFFNQNDLAGKAPPADRAKAGVVSPAAVPAGGFARRSTAKASFASSIGDGPRRSGVMSRRATSCG